MEPQKGERKKTAWSGLCGAGGGRAAGKSLRLPTPVCTQMAIKSVQFLDREAWSKDLLEALTKPDRTHQEQPPEKVAPSPLLPTARPGLCPWAAHLERGLGPWRKLEGRGLAARLEATPLELCHQAGGGWSIPRLTRARKAKAPGQGRGWSPGWTGKGGVRHRTGRQTRPQAFLFIFYGLVLQAEESGTTVRTHLRSLLETSHQWPKQREVRPRPRPSPTRLPRPRRSLSLVPPRARTLLTCES